MTFVDVSYNVIPQSPHAILLALSSPLQDTNGLYYKVQTVSVSKGDTGIRFQCIMTGWLRHHCMVFV